ncbi:hypothetical protein ABPG77_009952 [Micractinium sp. CCAP 211/92]
MKFQKQQAHSEFGRAWVQAGRQLTKTAASQPGGSVEQAATGKAVASFYASLVGSSGGGWVSGGTLQDAEKGDVHGGSTMMGIAAAQVAGQDTSADLLHAGLGSEAGRAELAAEAAALQYGQPAGPLLRGEQQQQQQQQQQQRERQQIVLQPPAGNSQQQQETVSRAPREGVRYGITRSNVGFQLLKKAGWREGAGLGAQEQGMAEPVAPFQQKGNLGLGFAPKQPKPKPGDTAAAGAGAAGQAGRGSTGGGGSGGQEQKEKRPLPEDPLNKEDQETKVKRVRQVMQAEADVKAGKAIERYMRMAFNDATGEPTADSNPLLRRNHKLSATNPLL